MLNDDLKNRKSLRLESKSLCPARNSVFMIRPTSFVQLHVALDIKY